MNKGCLSSFVVLVIAVIFFVSPVSYSFPLTDREKDFNTAERFFQRSEHEKALTSFVSFIRNYPRNDLTDDAIYRIGEIYLYGKDYSTALMYFQMITEEFPYSDLHSEVDYKMGVSYFYLKDHDRAIEIFKKILPYLHDQKRRSQIHFFIGQSYIEKGRYFEAIEEFKKTISISGDKDIITQSRESIKGIVMEKLLKSELEILTRRYSHEFPGGYSLFKLASIYYYRLRDYESFRTTLERFIKDFPIHENIEKAKGNLEEFPPILPFTKTKIGVVLPLSGKAAILGEKVLQGIQMAFNSLSPAEREVLELAVRDSEGDHLKAATVVRELAQDGSVIAIIGPVFSMSVSSVASIADDFHLPIFSPSASQEGIPELSKYLFRNSITNRLQGKTIAEYAVNNLNMKRFVTIYPDDNYGRYLKDIFIENIALLGGEVLAEKSYSGNDTDFKEQIKGIGGMTDEEMKKNALEVIDEITTEEEPDKERITRLRGKEGHDGLSILEIEVEGDPLVNPKTIKPGLRLNYDAIFIPGYHDKVGLIIPELAFYNITGVKCLGDNGWNSPDLIKIGGKYINGSIFVDGFFVNSHHPLTRRFVKDFRDIFRRNPDILSAQAYDAARIIITIFREGARAREDIKDALFMVKDYPGVSGKTTILPSGDSEKSLYILTIKNKKIVQIN